MVVATRAPKHKRPKKKKRLAKKAQTQNTGRLSILGIAEAMASAKK